MCWMQCTGAPKVMPPESLTVQVCVACIMVTINSNAQLWLLSRETLRSRLLVKTNQKHRYKKDVYKKPAMAILTSIKRDAPEDSNQLHVAVADGHQMGQSPAREHFQGEQHSVPKRPGPKRPTSKQRHREGRGGEENTKNYTGTQKVGLPAGTICLIYVFDWIVQCHLHIATLKAPLSSKREKAHLTEDSKFKCCCNRKVKFSCLFMATSNIKAVYQNK